jgi:hypothetical protein
MVLCGEKDLILSVWLKSLMNYFASKRNDLVERVRDLKHLSQEATVRRLSQLHF